MIQVKCDVYSFKSGNGCVDKKILIESAPSFPYKRKCINIILITLAAICGHGGALYINTSGCFLLWWSACSRLWVYREKKRNSFRDREEEDNEIPQISGESHGFYSLVRLQRISVNFCSISFFCPRVPVRGTVSFNWHCWLVRIGQTNRSVLIGCHVTCNRPKSPQGGTCDLISENVALIPRANRPDPDFGLPSSAHWKCGFLFMDRCENRGDHRFFLFDEKLPAVFFSF